ncbi:glycosyltransferase [bacterium]|nr:glycosyltransferase [bacterium]
MAASSFDLLCQGEDRPQATLLFPTYRSTHLHAALTSVLAQRDVILEILISDDASGDETPRRILDIAKRYHGPHRVLFRQGQKRLRLDHFTLMAEAASCDITLMAHHDDVAQPDRAQRILRTFTATGADVVASAFTAIQADGRPRVTNRERWASGFISMDQVIQHVWLWPMLGAGLAWRRKVYTDFPRLTTLYLPGGHDMLISFRGALRGGFYYLDEALFQRRSHAAQWGNVLFDMRGKPIAQEGTAARLLGVTVAMHKDVGHLKERAKGETPQNLVEIEEQITQSIMRRAMQLYDLRGQLLLAGKQAVWLKNEEFEALQRSSLLRRLLRREPFRSVKNWIQKMAIKRLGD